MPSQRNEIVPDVPIVECPDGKLGLPVRTTQSSTEIDWFDEYTDQFLERFLPIANSRLKDSIKHYMTDFLEYYFIAHYERIKLTIELLKDIVKPNDTILDLGSIFPLSTYWFYQQRKAKVVCADLCPTNWQISDTLFSDTIDLNSTMLEHLGGWPVINFQEVIEHLTCNLTEARDRIVKALAPGGYLLFGCPLISPHVRCLDKDLGKAVHVGDTIREAFTATLDPATVPADHKREFFINETEDFFPLRKVATKVVFTIGYTRGTVLILYRKD